MEELNLPFFGFTSCKSYFCTMILRSLSLLNYKNISSADLSFSPMVNCFVGDNGMGKTNLLDAIYYLSFCKSARCSTDVTNVKHGEQAFMLQGLYDDDVGGEDKIAIGYQEGRRKQLRRNGKDIKRFAEHIGTIPLVMISPSDSELVTGGSDNRRRFMDTVIAQYDATYLEALMRYEKTLRQRNALLKKEEEPEADVISIIEDMMSRDAAIIYQGRKLFVETFTAFFQDIYRELCYDPEQVNIVYESHGSRGELKPMLEQYRSRERLVGYTLHGIHKDDLLLYINGYPVKQEASQGQTKTYFIALKLAQYVYLRTKSSLRQPLLLLDDIFDKLDAGRVENIIRYAAEAQFGQIFITDTSKERLHPILQSQHNYKLFTVKDGEIHETQKG